MGEQILYEEQLNSKKTGGLFVVLATLIFVLFSKRVAAIYMATTESTSCLFVTGTGPRLIF